METKNEGRKYAVIAGVCCICRGLYSLIVWLQSRQDSLNVEYTYYGVFRMLFVITLLAFGLILITGNKGMLLIVSFGTYVVVDNVMAIYLSYFFSAIGLIYFIADLLLFCLILFNCTPSMKESAKRYRSLWFVPGVIILLACVYIWVNFQSFILSDATIALDAAVFLFVGFWLKETFVEIIDMNNT